MTREEAISQLKLTSWVQREQSNSYLADAIDMAIKSLEQESVLDKIRAEIEEMRSVHNCSCSDCLDIIDKYKAESEEQNANSD